MEHSGPSAINVVENVKDIEAEGVLATNNDNLRDSLESSGLHGNEVERPEPRVGIFKRLGLPDKIESDSRVEISGTSLKKVEKKGKCSGWAK